VTLLIAPRISIEEAESPHAVAEVRALLLEYEADTGVDLCFQGFQEELASLPGSYSRPNGRLFIARSGKEAIGCIALRPLQHGDAEMKRLYVRPSARARGVGQLLVNCLIEAAREIGYKRVLLDTLPTMARAQALYRSLGFVEIEAYCYNPVPGAQYFALEL
jgi:ribosomal protein S18 acetylase RimI-like enzyme